MAIFLQISFISTNKTYYLFENDLPNKKNTATQTTYCWQSKHTSKAILQPTQFKNLEVYRKICAHFQIISKCLFYYFYLFINETL